MLIGSIEFYRNHTAFMSCLSVIIIEGKNEVKSTKRLAAELGINHYYAEVLPENKASLIQGLQGNGKSVCFVGDGINDAIALKQANVSISLSGASTMATDCAQIIIMDGNLSQLVALFEMAQDLDQNLKRSLVASILPGIIVAIGVFFFQLGIVFAVTAINIGWIANIATAIGPFIRYQRERSMRLNDSSRFDIAELNLKTNKLLVGNDK